MFRDDLEFRKYLTLNLKDKIANSSSLPLKELMTAVIETLDIQEFRSEIVRFALNSELFYAFPVSYLISLLKRMASIAPFLANS